MSELGELLERFRRGPEAVAEAVTGAAGEELDFSPAPGKWSVRQILCHLADSEIVGADRFRRVIAEDNPAVIAYDQDAWAKNLDYGRRKIPRTLEIMRQVRAENHALLEPLPEVAFDRKGTHSSQGTITLLDFLRIYAGHTEKHAAQIQAVREAYKVSKRGT